MYTLEQVNNLLADIITVTFIKKSTGSARVMKCTKNLDKIDTKFHPQGSKAIVHDCNQVRVFDVEKNAWRSFDINSVVSIETA